ncbi:MAG: hypothetical protein IPG45_19800 [Deltaproteobacteria bacterium]|nr:hypothetical protein [Deltaproteobacteria bacterium]
MSLRFADLLRQTGLLKEEQLVFLMREHQRTGVRLGQLIADHHLTAEGPLYDALARVAGIKRMDLGTVMIDPNAASMVDPIWAERNGVAPLRIDARTRQFEVATADPSNLASLDELSFRSGLKVSPFLAAETEVARLNRAQFYRDPLDRMPLGGALPPPEEHAYYPGGGADPGPPPSPEEIRWLAQLQPIFEAQQESARALQVIFELCVARGIITKAEYVDRLRRTPD